MRIATPKTDIMPVDLACIEVCDIPPIRQRTANGWGTVDLWDIISHPFARKKAKG
jgi:hypothetical protein